MSLISLTPRVSTVDAAVGPIIACTTKIEKSLLDLNAQFIPESGNENRLQGDLFQFAATWKF